MTRSQSPVRTWLAALTIAALCAMPYLPGLRFGWVYDDHGAIEENPFLREPGAWRRVLSLDTLRDPHVIDGQRPVLLASLLVDRALWGDSPAGFHATNIALHVIAALLLFSLCARLTGSTRVALAAAILFGLHPVLVEAVQIPSYREDLLCAAMLLAALHASLARNAAVAALLSSAFAAAALLSKESGIALLVLMPAMWICFPSRRPSTMRGIIIGALLLAVTAVVMFAALGGRPLQASGGAWNGLSLRPPDNLLSAPWLFARYAALLVAPVGLSADHILSPVARVADPRFAAGVGAMALAVAGFVLLRRRAPLASWGCAWMLAAYAPVANIVPLFNPFAERYAYLIAMGFAVVAASALSSRRILLVLAAAALALATSERVRDFHDDRTLWASALRTDPGSARAHVWLGLIAKGDGERELARRRFEDAHSRNPHEVSAAISLAVLDGEDGDYAAAEARLRDALERRPDAADAWWNLAVALRRQGRDAEAEEALKEARRLKPSR